MISPWICVVCFGGGGGEGRGGDDRFFGAFVGGGMGWEKGLGG